MANERSPQWPFEQAELAKMVEIWLRSDIVLVDVRRQGMERHVHRSEVLATSAFIVVEAGTGSSNVQVRIDQHIYTAVRYTVFHAGRGSHVVIDNGVGSSCIWILQYRPEPPAYYKRELLDLLANHNPFIVCYGFIPHNSLLAKGRVHALYEKWEHAGPCQCFSAKCAFQQIVCDWFEEWTNRGVRPAMRDIAGMARMYLETHFHEPLSIQALANMLQISASQLSRVFKKRYAASPQDYLMELRLSAACAQLRSGESSVKEIALASGFTDEINLMRLFRKRMGMTPSQYRQNYTVSMHDFVIENDNHYSYNEEGMSLRRLDGFTYKGENEMLGKLMSEKGAKLMMATVLSLLLSACGSSATPVETIENERPSAKNAQNESVTQVEKPEDEEVEQVKTRIIETMFGEVEVPAHPQRVLVQYLTGDVVALGVQPVGISNDMGELPDSYREQVEGIAQLGHWYSWGSEAMLDLDPDLIISVHKDEKVHEQYMQIAPTVYVPYGTMTTEERLLFIGEVLNKEEEAQRLADDYTVRLDDLREQLEQAGLYEADMTTYSLMGDSIFLEGKKYGIGMVVYETLGLVPNALVQSEIMDNDKFSESLSLEVLPDYSGDYIIYNNSENAVFTNTEIWQLLPAVQAGRVVEVEGLMAFYTDILSQLQLMEELVQKLVVASQ